MVEKLGTLRTWSPRQAPAWVNSLANVGEHLVAQLGMAGAGFGRAPWAYGETSPDPGAQAAADRATPADKDKVAPSYVHFGQNPKVEVTCVNTKQDISCVRT